MPKNDRPKPRETGFAYIEKRRTKPWRGEEEVRAAWVGALELECDELLDLERTRKDSSFNNVIIEFKAPGLFNGSKTSAAFRNASEKRLLPYIEREAARTGLEPSDFIGICIDGEHVCFGQVQQGAIVMEHLLPFSIRSFELVVEAIKGAYRRPVAIDALEKDFGHRSRNARSLMQSLSDGLVDALRDERYRKVAMLFEEWRTLYGQVADMSAFQADAMDSQMAFTWKGPTKLNMPGRLFVIHTYNSLLIKLLAAEIVAAHGLTGHERPSQAMAAVMTAPELADALDVEIEHGRMFEDAGISGFVEEAIFSWYLDLMADDRHGERISEAVRDVLGTLSLYRTDRLGRTRDVLRDLYQTLVPGKLRQSLGEFYTPDWLIDFTLERAAQESWLEKRVLDPTCGSGAFLLAVMRLKRIEAETAGWTAEVIIDNLCSSVWGFDLNPLAVQTSRVNVLMEVADLLRQAPGHRVELPVLLADAIYSPARDPDTGEQVVRYRIGSATAGLNIHLPAELALDRVRLDEVFDSMGSDIDRNREFNLAEGALIRSGTITRDEAKAWRPALRKTYDQVLALHRRQWNGIWFRIVRNFFWSSTAGAFDVIVGNPPWVRWSKLPEAYRERVKPTCEAYGIFSKTKMHGGNELDISAMITYTTADKWLREGGRLAFVLTGTLFKNPSSAGFRDFIIDPAKGAPHLSPVTVDDFETVRPFEDAANHTVVAVFDKTPQPGSYPVPYVVWSKATKRGSRIAANLPLADVRGLLTTTAKVANPANGPGSPWSVLAPGRAAILSNIAGKNQWVAGRKGITTDLNGAYFLSILDHRAGEVQVRNHPEAGKKAIGPARTAWIESELVYPLVKGAGDFEECYFRLAAPGAEPLFAIVPNVGIKPSDYEAAAAAMAGKGLKLTRAWFQRFKAFLSDRATYRRQMRNAPEFAVYNVGDYAFAPWKVIWPEMASRFYAAVAGSANVPGRGVRPFVPDHKVYYVPFDDKAEAMYLCGLLNAPGVREWIQGHTVKLQIGNVFKHTRLPPYDAKDARHRALSAKVELAHQTHDDAARARLVAAIHVQATAIITGWKPPI